jgi:hypothetical protein
MGPAAIDRMLSLEPPREPLDNLAAVWRDFKWRRLKQGHRDPCITYTAKSPNIKVAVERACASRGEDGKLFFHQGRVWEANRLSYAAVLKAVRWELDECRNFHDLFLMCEDYGHDTQGIGPITIYDVTARLAAFKRLPAQRVYIHGGVRDGLEAIGIKTRSREWVERRELPRCLRAVKNLDHVEDFLCGYRVLIERACDGID